MLSMSNIKAPTAGTTSAPCHGLYNDQPMRGGTGAVLESIHTAGPKWRSLAKSSGAGVQG